MGALIVSLALAGCGAKSGLSKAELAKQADAICKRHYETIGGATNTLLTGGTVPNPQKLGQFVHETLIPGYTAEIRELRGLKARHGRGLKRYLRWLAASDAARAKLMQEPALLTNRANFAAVNGEADQLGFSKQCHVGPA